MTSTETSGWSPSATRTASASGPIASNPTASELESPRSGSGLTTRRSARQSIAASMAAASSPEDDDDVVDPGRRERVEDVLEDRPPADRRQQLAATEPRPGARREDESDRPSAHAGIFAPALRGRRVRWRPAGAALPSLRRSRAPARASARPVPP